MVPSSDRDEVEMAVGRRWIVEFVEALLDLGFRCSVLPVVGFSLVREKKRL